MTEHQFTRIVGADFVSDSLIAIADVAAQEVRIFSLDGDLVGKFGGKGDGPGEFRSIGALWTLPPDTVVVFDNALLRVTKALSTGDVVESRILDVRGRGPELFLGRFEDGDLAFVWMTNAGSGPDGMKIDTLEIGRWSSLAFERSFGVVEAYHRFRGQMHPLSPRPLGVVVHDSLYYTDGGTWIEVFDRDGERVRRMRLPPPTYSTSAAWAALDSAARARESTGRMELLAEAPRPAMPPSVSRLLTDDQGRLWTKAWSPLSDSPIETFFARWPGGGWMILDREGNAVAAVELPPAFSLLAVRQDLILGFDRDSLDVPSVAVYRLRSSE